MSQHSKHTHPHTMSSHHGEGGGGEDLQLVGGCTSGEHLLLQCQFVEPSSEVKDHLHHAPDPLDLQAADNHVASM